MYPNFRCSGSDARDMYGHPSGSVYNTFEITISGNTVRLAKGDNVVVYRDDSSITLGCTVSDPCRIKITGDDWGKSELPIFLKIFLEQWKIKYIFIHISKSYLKSDVSKKIYTARSIFHENMFRLKAHYSYVFSSPKQVLFSSSTLTRATAKSAAVVVTPSRSGAVASSAPPQLAYH